MPRKDWILGRPLGEASRRPYDKQELEGRAKGLIVVASFAKKRRDSSIILLVVSSRGPSRDHGYSSIFWAGLARFGQEL